MTNRRAFLFGASAALAAPAIVRASSLMKIWVPSVPKLIPYNSPSFIGVVEQIIAGSRKAVIRITGVDNLSNSLAITNNWSTIRVLLTTNRVVYVGDVLQYGDIA